MNKEVLKIDRDMLHILEAINQTNKQFVEQEEIELDNKMKLISQAVNVVSLMNTNDSLRVC